MKRTSTRIDSLEFCGSSLVNADLTRRLHAISAHPSTWTHTNMSTAWILSGHSGVVWLNQQPKWRLYQCTSGRYSAIKCVCVQVAGCLYLTRKPEQSSGGECDRLHRKIVYFTLIRSGEPTTPFLWLCPEIGGLAKDGVISLRYLQQQKANYLFSTNIFPILTDGNSLKCIKGTTLFGLYLIS